MRHDPASGAIIMLRSLKMHGMAQAVTDLMEQGAPAFDAAVPMLAQLLKAELAEREVRSIAYLNRPGSVGDLLLHFTRPYRARRAVHRSSLLPRLAGCFS